MHKEWTAPGRDRSGLAPLARDEHPRAIRRVGRARWKRDVGYHRRSMAETAVWRLEQLFGPGVAAKSLAAQTAAVRPRAAAPKRMTRLGMPDGYPVPLA